MLLGPRTATVTQGRSSNLSNTFSKTDSSAWTEEQSHFIHILIFGTCSGTCYEVNCPPPKLTRWSSNPRDLRMWPYSETGSSQIWLGKRGSNWNGVGPCLYDWCHYKKGQFGHLCAHRESVTCSLAWCCRKRGDHQGLMNHLGMSFPRTATGNPALPTLWTWTCSFQNSEKSISVA